MFTNIQRCRTMQLPHLYRDPDNSNAKCQLAYRYKIIYMYVTVTYLFNYLVAMSQLCIILLLLFKFVLLNGYPSETLMIMPPFEGRTVDKYPLPPQFQENRRQQILHTKVDQKVPQQSLNKPNSENGNSFVDELDKEEELSQLRTIVQAARDRNESAYRSFAGPYPMPISSGYGPSPAYQKPTPIAVPLAPTLSPLKPDLSALFKPVTTKVSSKASGLLGLILALFSGSSPDGLQMNGLKDIVINGILKPLLVAKGGIKSLIAKLTIPVIALLLINIEVLITVWWLWEDCGIQKPPIPTYPYSKPAYNNNYNNYNSYR